MAMGSLFSERDWNWAGAETEFRLAIEGRPSLAEAHFAYSFYLQSMGRLEEAIASARRATALDPLSPDYWSAEGRALYRARRYDEALKCFGRALELDPNFGPALTRTVDTYLAMGRFTDAGRYLEKSREALGDSRGQTAQLYAKTGRIAEARRLLAEIEREGTVAGGAQQRSLSPRSAITIRLSIAWSKPFGVAGIALYPARPTLRSDRLVAQVQADPQEHEPSRVNPPDVLVLGGGPAGSSAARLLATWGHSVRLSLARPRKAGWRCPFRPAVPGCLTRSA